MPPFLTVCITSYNGARYLRDCLDSLLNQTFQDFDVVIHDDQSSDSTLEILREYSNRDKRFNIYHNRENLGCIKNYNNCVSLAQGTWIKFLNHDDFLAPQCLEKMVQATAQNVPIICCRRDFKFEEGVSAEMKATVTRYQHVHDIFPDKFSITAREMSCAAVEHPSNNFIGEPTVIMLRREAFPRFGVLNPLLPQIADLEYWLRVSTNTGLVYVPETLAYFRIHNTSMTASAVDGKKFWSLKLEPLILLHEFTFNPIYENLRKVISEDRPSIDLRNLLSWSARALYSEIRNDKGPSAQEKLNAWKKMLEYYPAFKILMKRVNFNSGLATKVAETCTLLKFR